MTTPARTGAVLYVLDPERMARFYENVLALERRFADAHHVTLGSGDFELVVHAIPARIAGRIVLTSPPERREGTPIKLFYTVASLSQAARAITAGGGEVIEHGFEGDGFRVRDACDPEGNVFQLRERTGRG